MSKRTEIARQLTLREWRYHKLVDQNELASKLGVTQSCISKVESKGTAAISLRKAFRNSFGEEEMLTIVEFSNFIKKAYKRHLRNKGK